MCTNDTVRITYTLIWPISLEGREQFQERMSVFISLIRLHANSMADKLPITGFCKLKYSPHSKLKNLSLTNCNTFDFKNKNVIDCNPLHLGEML